MLFFGVSLLSSIVLTVFGAAALCWLGMWFGLRLTGQGRAVFWAVCLARGAPFALSVIWSMLVNLLIRSLGSAGPPFFLIVASLLPQTIDLFLFLGLIGLARTQLRKDLLATELLIPALIASRVSAMSRSVIHVARTWPSAE